MFETRLSDSSAVENEKWRYQYIQQKEEKIDKSKEIVSELNSDEKEELSRLSLTSSLKTLPGVNDNELAEDNGALFQSGEKKKFENDEVLAMEWMEDYKEEHESQLTGTKEGENDDLARDAW